MTQSIAVVTGAAGDIGRAICAALARDHDLVVLVDLDENAGNQALARLEETGGQFAFERCDVTSEAALKALAGRVAARGQVRTLVNNAGAAFSISIGTTTAESFTKDLDLNLSGPYLCFRAFENALKETQGSMINISSVNGIAAFGHPAYSAAKAGMIHLTRLIAVEFGKYGIRANVVAPGTVKTQAWEARAARNPNVFEDAKRWYPLQKIARPEDVANAVQFLASPLASAISGICLPVDCGLTAGQAELARTFSQSNDY